MKQPKQVFSYYGAKSKIAKYYPEPKHDTIIEPFAGSAAYAQRYWDRRVVLIDAFDKIVETWQYLISATRDDILELPDVDRETRVHDLDLPIGARHLIGWAINHASASPRNTPTQRAVSQGWWNRGKKPIAEIVHHFDHWEVYKGSYADLGNECATWYIDPPYQHGGEHYVKKDIDYDHLAGFCRSRVGQVIVCENTKADWLPFRPLVEISGMRHRTTETIWTPRILDQLG